jgi:hypothetical protein
MRSIGITLAALIGWLFAWPSAAQSQRNESLFCACLQTIHGKVIANERVSSFDTTGCFLEGKLLNCMIQPINGSIVVQSKRSGEKTFFSADSDGVFKGWIKHDKLIYGPYDVTITAPGYATFQLDSYTFNGGSCRFEVILGDDKKTKRKPQRKRQ